MVLPQIKMVIVQKKIDFSLLIKVNENHAFMQKSVSYLVVGVAYIHKEPPPVLGRTHIYELLQLDTVCILVRHSNTLTFSDRSNELVTSFLE